MQQPGRGTKVSLRGASVKEDSRDDILEKAAQERASRLHAKKAAASALFIQRIWRGRRAAYNAAKCVQADWDDVILQKNRAKAHFSAAELSVTVVRPLLFLIRQSTCYSGRIENNASRLGTGLTLLVDSIGSSDPTRNYCSLSLGSVEERARWRYQVYKIVSLCCIVLAHDGREWSNEDKAASMLLGLAMRVMVTLTDTTTWKSLSQEKDRVPANSIVFNLLEWLADGNAGLFPAVRSYLIMNHPVSRSGSQRDQSPDRDKFFVTASAITSALRPLILLCSESREEQNANSKELGSRRPSASQAALMFSKYILTIPFLIQRLPASLVPALRHPSALAPCLRSIKASTDELFRESATNSSSAQLSMEEQEYSQIPRSLWAVVSLVSLASGTSNKSKSKEFDGQFIKGLALEDYVEALCCLLTVLKPWVEMKQQERVRSRHAELDLDDLDIFQSGHILESSGFDSTEVAISGSSSVFQLLHETLKPLYQSWHLNLLVEASEIPLNVTKGNVKVEETSANKLDSSNKPPGLSVVATLYSNLLITLSVLNPSGGQLPVLNLLAFSKSFLTRLWEWLKESLDLRLPTSGTSGNSNTGRLRSSSLSKKSSVAPKDEASGKADGGKWSSAFGLKGRTRGQGVAEGSSSAEKSQGSTGSGSNTAQSQLWDLKSMKGGPAGVSADAVPVLSLFCASYAHLLMVVDDEEFYERQGTFTLDQQRLIAAMLNTMVYNGLISPSRRQFSFLTESAKACLRSLYERDCRRSFCDPALWLAPASSNYPRSAAAARAYHEVSTAATKMSDTFQHPGSRAVLSTIPHVLPFEERVKVFREFVVNDKVKKQGENMGFGPGTIEIAVRRDHVVEDGFAQLSGLGSKLKACINVSFVNELGLSEAGLDYGGLFKEFLTNLAKNAFDPGYGLFVQTATEEGLLFPHPAAASLGRGLAMIEFLGQIIGKALFEGILLEYSFAPLFVSKILGRNSFLDELSTLDAELHRNLMYLKHYDGDARDLALDFTVTEELFGRHTIVELRSGGADIPVTNENKLQYVYLMADYKLNRQMRPIIEAFSRGLSQLIPPTWLNLFNAKEFNQLLSGGEHDFDVEDLKAHTRYTGGFSGNSRPVKLFWEVVAGFEAHERCALLKFVTSCSRAPLLGFKHLQPAFTIHKVVCDASVLAFLGGKDVERLPSASTCYNTLKLPTYRRAGTLRDKLRYAILSNAGFELS